MILCREASERLMTHQVPVFPSFEVAARVMLNLKGYHDFLTR